MPNDDALTGTTDAVRPWTIKAISTQARDQAIAAARGEGVTVGQWLERRINEWAGRPSEAAPAPARTVGANADLPRTNPTGFADVAEMARLAIALSQVPPEHRKDPVLRSARTTVRAALLALRPQRRVAAPRSRAIRSANSLEPLRIGSE